jgi:hypothetical protein
MTSAFDQPARVVSGTTAPPRPVGPMRVTAADGRLRVLPADRKGVVLDVDLTRVRAAANDDDLSVRVEIDGVPLVLTFGDVPRVGGRRGRLRRFVDERRTRRVRRAFLGACASGP